MEDPLERVKFNFFDHNYPLKISYQLFSDVPFSPYKRTRTSRTVVYLDVQRSDSRLFRVDREFGRLSHYNAARLKSVAVTIYLLPSHTHTHTRLVKNRTSVNSEEVWDFYRNEIRRESSRLEQNKDLGHCFLNLWISPNNNIV